MTDLPCPWTFPRVCGNGHALLSVDDVYLTKRNPQCRVCTANRVRRQRGLAPTRPQPGEPALRVLIWTLLPPQGPGLTREEIRQAVADTGRGMNGQTLDLMMTALRQVSALRNDVRVPRRYWRGEASAEDVAGREARRDEWSDPMKAQLRKLWPDKTLTINDMGRRIGKLYGRTLSKNAIYKAADRLGLPARDMPQPVADDGPPPLTARGLLGGGALPAGHPLTWGLLVAHTPSISSRWPG